MVKEQIKFWVFGLVGAVGVYLLLTGLGSDLRVAIGVTLIVATVGAFILGVTWNVEKDGEKAATYDRMRRDELAKQAWESVKAESAKQIEAPRKRAKEA